MRIALIAFNYLAVCYKFHLYGVLIPNHVVFVWRFLSNITLRSGVANLYQIRIRCIKNPQKRCVVLLGSGTVKYDSALVWLQDHVPWFRPRGGALTNSSRCYEKFGRFCSLLRWRASQRGLPTTTLSYLPLSPHFEDFKAIHAVIAPTILLTRVKSVARWSRLWTIQRKLSTPEGWAPTLGRHSGGVLMGVCASMNSAPGSARITFLPAMKILIRHILTIEERRGQ